MSEFEIVKGNGVKCEATCLSLTRRMTIEEASQFVLGLDSMESGMNWWVGDFLIAMETLHGEAYTQIIPESKAHTWHNYMWVASRVKRRSPPGEPKGFGLGYSSVTSPSFVKGGARGDFGGSFEESSWSRTDKKMARHSPRR